MLFAPAYSFAFIVSLLVAITIIFTRHIHGHLTFDNSSGVQKLHTTPTPRVGGFAVAIGTLVGGINLPLHWTGLWWLLCLAVIPAFLAGFLEDLTKRIDVKTRFVATMLSGVLFCLLTGYGISDINITGVDWLLSFWLSSLLFTAFAISGVSNSINIIDGVNGFAAGTAIIILIGFAVVASNTNDLEVLGICLIMIGALVGFFLVNFPMGRIFLGDAGAYAIGFFLAAVSIALPARNAELSPLLGLLGLAYPVVETLISIQRRLVREGAHPGRPDRLHLHSLVYRRQARRLADLLGIPQMGNALTSIILWPLPLLSVVLMVLSRENSGWILINLVLFAVVYILIYRRFALLGLRSRSPDLGLPDTQSTPPT